MGLLRSLALDDWALSTGSFGSIDMLKNGAANYIFGATESAESITQDVI